MKKLDPYLRYIATTTYLPNKSFVKAHDCRFFFVLSGKGEFKTENLTVDLVENSLVYYPSGVSYFLKSDSVDPLHFITVNFDFTHNFPRHTAAFRPVEPIYFQTKEDRPTHLEIEDAQFYTEFVINHAAFLRSDFTALSSLFEKNETYKEEICNALLKYIIYKMANYFSSTHQENKTVREVIDFIEANYDQKLDNNTVALQFGYHPYYLSNLFKIHTGMPLHKYILDTRLRYACDLLRHTDLTIGEIASKCGFQNANHFSAKFKNYYNESPTRWRKSNSFV